MWDWLRARKEGRDSSGNGRRESYQHLPMVRMTNTYVAERHRGPRGDRAPDAARASTSPSSAAARSTPATGDFVFGMTEAYLIEDGRITEPLRDANLIGNGPDVLRNIDVVGNDFAMGAPGTCGKDGQGVPVGDGQPTLRVTRPHRRRDGGMTRTASSSTWRRRVAGWARDGEQVEAYVARRPLHRGQGLRRRRRVPVVGRVRRASASG